MVSIIDYGMGNVSSVRNAFQFLGEKVSIASTPQEILNAESLVLPGVGSFFKGMQSLSQSGLDQAIVESVVDKKVKILGICLGMQLLGASGVEGGAISGLNMVPNKVEAFSKTKIGTLKVPHVGFDAVSFNNQQGLFKGLGEVADFYFMHSFKMEEIDLEQHVGHSLYGEAFVAAFQNDHICGAQFHPEKSQTNGLKLLKNFIEL